MFNLLLYLISQLSYHLKKKSAERYANFIDRSSFSVYLFKICLSDEFEWLTYQHKTKPKKKKKVSKDTSNMFEHWNVFSERPIQRTEV